MLRHLTINNYVLIESLDIDLLPGFSVVTGETGAGKSIILDALGLLMGQRADAGSIMPGAAKCTVEGIFVIEGYGMQSLFDENGLDYEPSECILRREVSGSGKSRAFVNDSPVGVAVLRRIAFRLLDIHSQHSNLLLENPAFQLGVVDAVCQHPDLLSRYGGLYTHIVQARLKLKEMEENLAARRRDEDYLRFQLSQLDEFKPRQGEDEELRRLQGALSHAGDIKIALSGIDALLNGSDGEDGAGAIDALRRSCQALQQTAKVYPAIQDYVRRLESVVIEVRDIASDVVSLAEEVEYNPSRLQQVTERMDALFALEQKHHVGSSEELMALADDIRSQLDSLTCSKDEIEALRQEIEAREVQARKLAEELSAERQGAARQIERLVSEALVEMDMPAAVFRISIEKRDELLREGQDMVTFLFSADGRSMVPRPLADVASGGEMSRVMLALKALTSRQMHLPTILFDEIDTGVSGKVASLVARMMARMCEAGGQVISITHLPQIAAMADTHYLVYKDERDGRTLTRIRRLGMDGRITELAHMLSGSKVTEAAMENARQLLSEHVECLVDRGRPDGE